MEPVKEDGLQLSAIYQTAYEAFDQNDEDNTRLVQSLSIDSRPR